MDMLSRQIQWSLPLEDSFPECRYRAKVKHGPCHPSVCLHSLESLVLLQVVVKLLG